MIAPMAAPGISSTVDRAVQFASVRRTGPTWTGDHTGSRPAGPVLAWWSGLLVAAFGLAFALGGRVRLGEVPAYAALPPLVAVGVLVLVGRGLHRRLPWVGLLAATYGLAAVWSLGLSAADGPPLDLTDMAGLAGLAGLAGTPPLAGWLAGLGAGTLPAVGAIVVAALGVPLTAVAVGSLCGPVAARELLPLLVLAPFAAVAAGTDGVAWALGTAALAAAAVGSEHGRRGPLRLVVAVGAGLLLGTAALIGYVAALLAAGVVCVYFVRRRPLLNVAAAAGFLVPILVSARSGTDWTAALGVVLRGDGGTATAVVLALVAGQLLVLGGPALVASARSVRTTPGWPGLVAGAVGAVGAVALDVAADRVFAAVLLPVLPWLLVGAVAPAEQGGPSRPVGLPILATGAAAGYLLALLG